MENVLLLSPLAHVSTGYHYVGIKFTARKLGGSVCELQRNQQSYKEQIPSLTKCAVSRETKATTAPPHSTQLQSQGRQTGANLWAPIPKAECRLAQLGTLLTLLATNDHFLQAATLWVHRVLQVKVSHSKVPHTCIVFTPLDDTCRMVSYYSLQSHQSLTLHQQSENVTVLVRELVQKKVSPVLTEKIKWHQNIFIWFKAPGRKCQMNGLQKPGAIRQRRFSGI